MNDTAAFSARSRVAVYANMSRLQLVEECMHLETVSIAQRRTIRSLEERIRELERKRK